jgi:SnoaL-like protein
MATNTELIRGIYDAFDRQDVAGVLGALAPEVSWTEAEGFPYGGTYTGPSAILENVFMKLATEWINYAAVPDEFVAQGEKVVALGRYSRLLGAFCARLDRSQRPGRDVPAAHGHGAGSEGAQVTEKGLVNYPTWIAIGANGFSRQSIDGLIQPDCLAQAASVARALLA